MMRMAPAFLRVGDEQRHSARPDPAQLSRRLLRV